MIAEFLFKTLRVTRRGDNGVAGIESFLGDEAAETTRCPCNEPNTHDSFVSCAAICLRSEGSVLA